MDRFVCFRTTVAFFGPTGVRRLRLRLLIIHGVSCCRVCDGYDLIAFVPCRRHNVCGSCSPSMTTFPSLSAFVFIRRGGPRAASHGSDVGSILSRPSRWRLCQSTLHMYKSYNLGEEAIHTTLTTNSQSSSQFRRPNR
jgi:hypothetical protein